MKKINFSKYTHLSVKNQRVMVVPLEIDYSKSKGGIQLTSNKPTFKQGVVVALGKGFYAPDGGTIPLDYQIGDVVYFGDQGVDFKVRRENGEYEDVVVVSVESIYYVDGTGKELYEEVNE